MARAENCASVTYTIDLVPPIAPLEKLDNAASRLRYPARTLEHGTAWTNGAVVKATATHVRQLIATRRRQAEAATLDLARAANLKELGYGG